MGPFAGCPTRPRVPSPLPTHGTLLDPGTVEDVGRLGVREGETPDTAGDRPEGSYLRTLRPCKKLLRQTFRVFPEEEGKRKRTLPLRGLPQLGKGRPVSHRVPTQGPKKILVTK